MATSSEGGASAAAYGGGGAGGKFRKKPFHRAHIPTTPYDRPLTARISKPNNGSSDNPGLFTKLVVEPASKIISYGAHRFFSSVFRKRLPPPAPEVNYDLTDELQVAVSDMLDKFCRIKGDILIHLKCDLLKSGGGTSSQAVHSSADGGLAELEQLLKQKTFSRSEIDHLTGLLQSRAAVEFSPSVGPKRSEEGAPDFERHQPFASSPSEVHMQEDRSLRVMSSPITNSRVIEDDMASPAELAKAYMGSRPSKVSPSNVGTCNQVRREDAGLLSNVPFASKSPNMSLNMITSAGLGNPKNGFITPKSRGRSAIYSMARTPYSRVHPLSIKKEIGSANNFYGELSIPSSSPSLVEQKEKSEAKSMTLKRRSSVLDDDPGSVGPMRRLRQKPNLLASKIPLIAHGVESGSDHTMVSSKQKLSLVVEQKNRVSKIVGQNEDGSIPSASYTCVSSKSSEVAARILQHLEKLTPKEKSSESKLATVREKSTFRLTPSMLRGQALRSMEDVDSSRLLLAVQDDHKLEDRSDVALSHDQDSTLQKSGKVEENGPKESVIISDMLNPVVKNDFVESSTVPGPSNGNADSVVKNSAAQHPQTKRAFRMSAQEDFLELDDDEHCYEHAARSLEEERGPPDVHTLGNKCSPDEEPELVKTTIIPEVKLPVVLSKITESSNPSTLMIGTGNDGISLSSSEEKNVAIQSDVLSPSDILFDKPNGTVPLLRYGSKTVHNTPPLPSESVSLKPESKSENSISLLGAVSTANAYKMETPESDQDVHLNPLKTRDANGKPHTAPVASNGPLISRAPAVSFTTSHDNLISTAISSPLISSSSIASFGSIGTSTNTTSSASIASFGLTGFGSSTFSTSNGNGFRSNADGPVFKFGASVDHSSALSAASTTSISEVADLKTKAEKEPNPGSSSGIHSAVTSFVATNSGSSPLGPSTSISNSSANNFQGSLPATANKSSLSNFGLVSQSTSAPFGSSVSLPSLNMNGSMSLSTSLSHHQFNPNQSLGFSTSTSSAETSTVKSGSGPTSSVGKFGASSALSGDSAVSLNARATPGIFGFGLSSSSTAASAVGSTNGVTPPVVNYGGNSVATSVTNNASSSSIGTPGIFNFVASSSASTSAASNIFGSTWESPKPLVFSSTFTTSSPSNVFSFGATSSTLSPANATSTVFNSQSGPSSSSILPFSTSSPTFSLPSVSLNQPIFGIRPSFAVSPSSGDQMNAEDSMAEDPVQSSAPSIPMFGQPIISPSPPGFMFGSTAPPLSNPFQFSGQQNQIAPLNPSPFQASGSLEFNSGGGSFSLGSSGADKSGRKFVKANRNKNRKK